MKIDLKTKPVINGFNLLGKVTIGELSGTLATDKRGVYAMLVGDDVKWLNQNDVKKIIRKM